MDKQFDEALKLISNSKNILVLAHKKPDVDTLGASLAMHHYLKKISKNSVIFCKDKPSRDFDFLPFVKEVQHDYDLSNFDLLITIDLGSSYMSGLDDPDLYTTIPVINIDHHASNDNFGTINIVDADAASTTIIIHKFFKHIGFELDRDISTCLLSGIYSDTGSFMHSNTNHDALEIASELMEKGGKIAEVNKILFNTRSVKSLKMWGHILENAYLNQDNVLMSVVKEEDYKSLNGGPELTTGVVEYLNMVPSTKYALLLKEVEGTIKGSMRTKNSDIDLSKLAKNFGGGGHPAASGFTIEGSLEKKVGFTIVSDKMSKKSFEF